MKRSFLYFSVLLLLLVAVFLTTFFYKNNCFEDTNNTQQVSQINNAIHAPQNKTVNEEATQNDEVTIIPSPDSNINLLEIALNEYFDLKTGGKIMVSQQTNKHAQGEFGQQWWLAFNDTLNGWQVVATGYSYIDCKDISKYDFPSQIVPACWDYSSNQLINR